MDYPIWELACLSILPFFQDLQVIPKEEGTWFPIGDTPMLRKYYRSI
jgi:hypothetical protein